MGVLGLWQMLESVGHPIKLEALEGKRLGVDASIWLYKFIRGYREKDNAPSIDSHKLGLFNRISKLLFYKIKPVFVFDGPAPILKRRTLERRQNLRGKQLAKVQDAALKLLVEQLKEQYPDANIDNLKFKIPDLKSHSLVAADKLTDEDRELFYLPPEVIEQDGIVDNSDSDQEDVKPSLKQEHVVYHIDSDDEYSSIETKPSVDIHSKDFEGLPAEVRYEILVDIREERRKIRRRSALPEDAQSFSNFQMERLRAKRMIQEKIEKCEKDICSMYTGELGGQSVQSYRVQSDANSTLLYLKNATQHSVDTPTTSQQSNISNLDSDKLAEDSQSYSNIRDQSKTCLASSNTKDKRHLNENRKLADETEMERKEGPKKARRNSVSMTLDLEQIKMIIDDVEYRSEISDQSEDCELIYDDLDRHSVAETITLSEDDVEDVVASTVSSFATTTPTATLATTLTTSTIPSTSTTTSIQAIATTIPVSSSVSQHTVAVPTVAPAPVIANPVVIPAVTVESTPNVTSIVAQNLTQSQPKPQSQSQPKPQSQSQPKPQSQSQSQPKPQSQSQSQPKPQSQQQQPQQPQLQSQPQSQPQQPQLQPQQPQTQSQLQQPQQQQQRQPDQTQEQQQQQQPQQQQEEQEELQQQQQEKHHQTTQISEHQTQHSHREVQSQPFSTRTTNNVTTKIVEEAKELLRLFGIPYIDAAGEAEAQCALLEKLNLTEGTITDDSDVWLFGSQNVYRYFFSDDKYVMQYKMTDIEFHVRMNRENLVCFAMLVGSDYTDGIRNIGPVTALEVLSEFPGENMEPLLKFKNWRDKYDRSKERIPGSKKRETFLKFKLPEEFPSRAVFEGYLQPQADTSTEKFSWGIPDLDELREYARRNFGWDNKKIDDKLLPVMKKLNERRTQSRIDSFFFKTAANMNPELFRSKRVNQALNKIASTTGTQEVNLTEDEDGDDESEQPISAKSKRKVSKKDKKDSTKRADAVKTAARKRIKSKKST